MDNAIFDDFEFDDNFLKKVLNDSLMEIEREREKTIASVDDYVTKMILKYFKESERFQEKINFYYKFKANKLRRIFDFYNEMKNDKKKEMIYDLLDEIMNLLEYKIIFSPKYENINLGILIQMSTDDETIKIKKKIQALHFQNDSLIYITKKRLIKDFKYKLKQYNFKNGCHITRSSWRMDSNIEYSITRSKNIYLLEHCNIDIKIVNNSVLEKQLPKIFGYETTGNCVYNCMTSYKDGL